MIAPLDDDFTALMEAQQTRAEEYTEIPSTQVHSNLILLAKPLFLSAGRV